MVKRMFLLTMLIAIWHVTRANDIPAMLGISTFEREADIIFPLFMAGFFGVIFVFTFTGELLAWFSGMPPYDKRILWCISSYVCIRVLVDIIWTVPTLPNPVVTFVHIAMAGLIALMLCVGKGMWRFNSEIS